MRNIDLESKNKPVNLKEKISSEFSVAIWKLYNDGSLGDLITFVKNNEKMLPMTLEIDKETEKYIGFAIDSSLTRIEKDLNYDYALEIWKLLKNTGVLTEEKLSSYIKQYIEKNMMFAKEEIQKIEKRTGIKNPQYSKEFLDEFVKDLKSKIKNSLYWDIDIDLKQKEF